MSECQKRLGLELVRTENVRTGKCQNAVGLDLVIIFDPWKMSEIILTFSEQDRKMSEYQWTGKCQNGKMSE